MAPTNVPHTPAYPERRTGIACPLTSWLLARRPAGTRPLVNSPRQPGRRRVTTHASRRWPSGQDPGSAAELEQSWASHATGRPCCTPTSAPTSSWHRRLLHAVFKPVASRFHAAGLLCNHPRPAATEDNMMKPCLRPQTAPGCRLAAAGRAVEPAPGGLSGLGLLPATLPARCVIGGPRDGIEHRTADRPLAAWRRLLTRWPG